MGDAKNLTGTIELLEKGGGFLRQPSRYFQPHPSDPFVPQDLIRAHDLRGGEDIQGTAAARGGTKHAGQPKLGAVELVNGEPAEAAIERPSFASLTAINPDQRIRFERPDGPLSMRVVDLMTPIGLGQRGLIAAPPRTGKTMLLQQMAAGLAANHPDVYMIVLLIDERPEEVTEMRRSVHGEVIASSNDQNIASHVRVARIVIEKAKRLLESGRNVFVLLDSLTRLGRAFNAFQKGGGRIMSGGLDTNALTEPKAMFGAARNVENGGSLTIIASALIETGSRMDEVIFNEFKGTGNMEIMLCRDMANKRVWPAIDLAQSGTRREELLLSEDEINQAHAIRRTIASRSPDQAMKALLDVMAKHKSNDAFVKALIQA